MHVLDELSDLLEEQVEKIVKKGDISPTELENVYKAVKTMNNIETIYAMKDYGQSNDGSYNSYGNSNRGSYRGSYDGGASNRGSYNSYDGRRGRDGDSDGRYSEESSYRRGGRYSREGYARDGMSRDGYSRADEKKQMISKLERMMDSANSEVERQTIMDCINKLDN